MPNHPEGQAGRSALVAQLTPTSSVLLTAAIWAATGLVCWPIEPPTIGMRELLGAACQHKLIPELHAFWRHQGWPVEPALAQLAAIVGRCNAVQFETMAPVFQTLAVRNTPILALKGAHLALGVYGPERARMMVDIDALIQLPDLDQVRAIFKHHGFVEGALDIQNLRIRSSTPAETEYLLANHYEIAPTCKLVRVPEFDAHANLIRSTLPVMPYVLSGDFVYVSVACDLHFNVSTGIAVDDLWRATETMALADGTRLGCLNASVLLWFLCARTYHEVMESQGATLRQFADLLAVIKVYEARIDWNLLEHLAIKYDTQPSLFYTLWHARELLADSVPEHIVCALDPTRPNVKRLHDWGDFMPKLLGLSVPIPLLGSCK